MKIISFLIFLSIYVIVNCNQNNLINNDSNETIIEISSSIVSNETEPHNLTAFISKEDISRLITENETFFVIKTNSDETRENIDQPFNYSTETSPPNTQIETDLLNEENSTTSTSSVNNISILEIKYKNFDNESQDLEKENVDEISKIADIESKPLNVINEKSIIEINSQPISEVSDLETTTLDTITEIPHFESTPLEIMIEKSGFKIIFDSISNGSDLETTTLDTINEISHFGSTPLGVLNEKLGIEVNSESVSNESDLKTTTLDTITEIPHFESTPLDVYNEKLGFDSNSDSISNGSDLETKTLDTITEIPHFESTHLGVYNEKLGFDTNSDSISNGSDLETITLDTITEIPHFESTPLNVFDESSEFNSNATDFETTLITNSGTTDSVVNQNNAGIKSRNLKPKVELSSDFKVFCAFGNWAASRRGEGKFDVRDLNRAPFVLNRCSYIIYAFAGLNSSGNVISFNPNQDLDSNFGTFAKLVSIKESHQHLKTLVAIGGWDTPSYIFSSIISNDGLRQKLTQSITVFAKQHSFDGILISWFFPGSKWRGGQQSDKHNFVHFLQELKTKMHSNGLELGVMGPALEEDINSGFDVPQVSNIVDHLLLMTYDYFGSWNENVNHFAPLYANNKKSTKLNINNTLNYWLNRGALRANTVLGLATYGRSFTLADPLLNKINSPSIGPGIPGPYTNRPGVIGFNEICEVFLSSPGVKLGEDNYKVTPYIHLYDQWIGFEDELSLFLKTLYAMDNKLEGVLLWSIDLDDFQNKCGWGHFPLLRASIQAIYKDQNIH